MPDVPRIRTIKPEFFTSEDIMALSPPARLLYIGLWCESDREGRLKWRPGTFKLRYLPKDDVQIEAVAAELLERKLVVLYGDGLAHIPRFLDHQHINPREAKSTLPPQPVDNSRDSDASARVSDVQVGREGRERKEGNDASRRVEAPQGDKSPKFKDATSPANGGWWKTDRGIDDMGKELGVPPQRGESYPQYKDRLFLVIAKRKQAVA